MMQRTETFVQHGMPSSVQHGMPSSATVVHSCVTWLPRTMVWLHTLITTLPDEIVNMIVCEQRANIDEFQLSHITCAGGRSLAHRLDRFVRRTGLKRDLIAKQSAIKRHHPTIIHSHCGYVGWRDAEIASRLGVRHIVSVYGADVSRLPFLDASWLRRYRDLFRTVDLILCEGPFMAARLVSMGCPESKVRVHHLGVPIESIPFRPRRWNSGERLKVFICGSFVEKKGITIALDALGAVKKTLDIEITLIGDAPKWDRTSLLEKKRITEVIAQHGLERNVRMLGYQPYATMLAEAYDHHIFLAPSVRATDGDDEGGAPVTLIEMAATGMPVVSTFHCDIPEVVRHGIEARLAEPGNSEDLYRQIMWLVLNTCEWDRLISNARHRIESEFNAPRQAMRLAELYKSYGATSRSAPSPSSVAART